MIHGFMTVFAIPELVTFLLFSLPVPLVVFSLIFSVITHFCFYFVNLLCPPAWPSRLVTHTFKVIIQQNHAL